jgi:YidC/Oxa1 family membrane protein insertase
MQRNLVLACVLTVVITVVWGLLNQKLMPQQVPSEPDTTPVTQVEEPDRRTDIPPPAEKPPAPQPPVDVRMEAERSRDVVVETSLMKATFTNLGARVKSIKLKAFSYKNDDWVDVVPQYEEYDGDLPLSMTLHNDAGGDVLNELAFDVEQDGYNIRFERALSNGLFVTKEFQFNDDNYGIGLTVGIENRGESMIYVGEDEEPSYVLWWGPGIEKTESDRYNQILFTAMNEGKFLHKREGSVKSVAVYRQLSWIGLKSRYFAAVVVPLATPVVGRALPMGPNEIAFELQADSFRLDPGESRRNEYCVYAGPQDMALLKDVGHELELAVNFGFFDAFSKIMLKILKLCYKVVPNYGIGIILLTILVRMVLYPLTHKSMQSMKKMQELQPEMAKFKEKYKDNPQELNKRMMAFYKERGVNPMGGCLPMMLQMPIWFALFGVYKGAIELRGAPFFGWISDLSEPDTIATLPFSIPFLGDGVHVLPLLMAAAMFLQQKLASPGGAGQTEQQKMMMFMFPVMFGFLFYNMPSGLCLYIFVSSLLYFAQQMVTNKGYLFRRAEQAEAAK